MSDNQEEALSHAESSENYLKNGDFNGDNNVNESDKKITNDVPNNNEKSSISLKNSEITKKLRPKILPPYKSSSDEESEKLVNGLFRLQGRVRRTNRLKPYFTNNLDQRSLRNRYLIRLNQDSTPQKLTKNQTNDENLTFEGQLMQKCYDYAELGYCLRGNNCPLIHGSNSIVVKDSTAFVPSVIGQTAIDVSTGLPFQQQTQKMSRLKTCSFLIRKIPPHCNNVSKINEYFGQFGEIKHIQVAFNAADSALVTYETYESALKAFRSKKPIFDNRFVVFKWYNPETDNLAALKEPANIEQNLNQLDKKTQIRQKQLNKPQNPNTWKKFTKTYDKKIVKPTKIMPSIDDQKRKIAKYKKNERLLNLKADLYLKLNEQARLVLLKAQCATESNEKLKWEEKIKELQKNLVEVRETIVYLHKKIQKLGGTENKMIALLKNSKNGLLTLDEEFSKQVKALGVKNK